ncbi:MAG: hypothetical protein ABH864_00020 [archaeon]
MVYEKYIKRGNKLHGPYYYESYRDGAGKIKKRYLGTSLDNPPVWKREEFFLVLGIVFVLLLFGGMRMTGFVALDSGAMVRGEEGVTGEMYNQMIWVVEKTWDLEAMGL